MHDIPVLPDSALLDRINQPSVPPGGLLLTYLGGGCWVIQNGAATLWVDPFFTTAPDHANWTRSIPIPGDPAHIRRADLVLITHEHEDHCDPVSLGAIARQTGALLLAPAESARLAAGWGYPAERLRRVAPGTVANHGGFGVQVLAAHDPMAIDPVMYLVEAAGRRLLFGGDTLYSTGFAAYRNLGIDVAVLSIGHNPPGVNWYMTESDACRTARDLGARRLIPQHWEMWKQTRTDPAPLLVLMRNYSPDIEVKIISAFSSCELSARGM